MKTQNRLTLARNLLLGGALACASFLAPTAGAQSIPNASFEANSFGNWPGYISGNVAISNWTGLPTDRVGLNPAGGSPFADNGAVPNGANVALIQSDGDTLSTLATTITGLTPGMNYQVNFQANCRSGYGPPNSSWSLNGGAFVQFTASPEVGGTNAYYTVTGTFTATSNSAALVLRNQTPTDTTLLVDDFSIAALPTIFNPSFEADSFTNFPGYASANGGGITGWTLSDPARIGLNPAGGSPFADNGATPHGSNVAFVQSGFGSFNSLSGTIAGLIPGNAYQVTFRANSRAETAPANPSWSLNGGAFVPFVASPPVGGSNGYHLVTGFLFATGSSASMVIANQTDADSTVLVDDFSVTTATAVTTNSDAGAGSLRQALVDTPLIEGARRIALAPQLSGQTITLTSGELALNTNVIIDATSLPGGLRIDGNNASRVFSINAGASLSLSRLTLTNGYASNSSGGAIQNLGQLVMSECLVISNKTADLGGAVWNAGTMTVNRSTFAGNSSTSLGAAGGAIHNRGTATVDQSTFTGNSANGGGAIFAETGSQTTLRHCTIFNNAAFCCGGGVSFYAVSNQTMLNCIVAGNGNGDIYLPFGAFTDIGNLVGGDPMLAPLGNYGGFAPTMPPLPGSPALDAAASSDATTDQRGYFCPIGSAPDVGAVEFGPLAPTISIMAGYYGATLNSATLYATVNPNGADTIWYFRYGLTTNYGQSTSANGLAANNVPSEVSAGFGGLQSGTTYHYAIVASNSAGMVSSGDFTFTTRSQLQLTISPATGVSNTTATLNALVNPDGAPALVWFWWGPATGGVWQSTSPAPVVPVHSNVLVSTVLNNIIPGVTYRYLAMGSNQFTVLQSLQMPFGSPAFALHGGELLTNECHVPFNDPGTTASDTVQAMASGSFHGIALMSDGRIAGWGDNTSGRASPPANLGSVTAPAAGGLHSLALKSDGSVTAWGDNFFGQTNVPANLSNVTALAGGHLHSLARRNDGTVAAWGAGTNTSGGPHAGQSLVPIGLSDVIAIAAGGFHSLALRTNGRVVVWGSNNSGQTNVPANLSNVVAIAGGLAHSLALRADGKVVAWGANGSGQTNVPATLSNVVAIASRGDHSLALKNDGTVVGWGLNIYGQCNVPGGLSNVAAIAAGAFHSLALKSNGTIVAWGRNDDGQVSDVELVNPRFVAVTGSVDVNTPGTYSRAYTITNSLGGIGTLNRTVLVQDTLPPVITLAGANPWLITNVSNLQFVDPGATANDLCVGSLPLLVTNWVNTNWPGTYAITYSATDAYGNNATAVREVVVTLAPSAPPSSGVPGDQNGDGIVNQSELDAVYARYLANSPWLQMTNVAGLGTSNVSFALPNPLTGGYTVEASIDLVTWETLGPASPRYEFLDTNAPAGPMRYYRLRHP